MNSLFKLCLAAFTVLLLVEVQTCFAEDHNKPEDSLVDQIKELTDQMKRGTPRFSLVGTLEHGRKTKFSVNGEDFEVDENAIITGDLKIGNYVNVDGKIVDEKKVATNLLIEAPQNPASPELATEAPGSLAR